MSKGTFLGRLFLCTSISLYYGVCSPLTAAADPTTDALIQELKNQGWKLQETKGRLPKIGNCFGTNNPWTSAADHLAFCKQWVDRYQKLLGFSFEDLANPEVVIHDQHGKQQVIRITYTQNHEGIPVKPGGVLFIVNRKNNTQFQLYKIDNQWVAASELAKLDTKPKVSWDTLVDKAAAHYLSHSARGSDLRGKPLPHRQTAETLKPDVAKLKSEQPHTLQIQAYGLDVHGQLEPIPPRLVYEFVLHDLIITIDARTGEVTNARPNWVS